MDFVRWMGKATRHGTLQMEEDERKVLTWIQSGAAWTGATLEKTGSREDGLCRWCQQKEHFDHFSTCPALKEKRIEIDRELDDCGAHLPTSIKLGIAPAMKINAERT